MLPKAPLWWQGRGVRSTALLPVAAAYGVISSLHRAFARPVWVDVPVICIGNVVAGGAGKTPVALAVAELLKQFGVKPFFLSRGYGGTERGPLLVDFAQHMAGEVGDEPLLLAASCPTVVAADRVAGAVLAISHGAQAIIMDDGFQNDALHKDFSLLVADAAYGFGNGRLLPAGPLRETVKAAVSRADAVVVMDGTLSVLGGKPVLHASLQPDEDAAAHSGKRVVGFAGIGRPEKFRHTLRQMKAEVVAFVPFADHCYYPAYRMEALLRKAEAEGAALVTTAKDAVRLPEAFRGRVSVVNVKAHITEAEQLKTMLKRLFRGA